MIAPPEWLEQQGARVSGPGVWASKPACRAGIRVGLHQVVLRESLGRGRRGIRGRWGVKRMGFRAGVGGGGSGSGFSEARRRLTRGRGPVGSVGFGFWIMTLW